MHYLFICEEELKMLWESIIAGRDTPEIDKVMGMLREAIIHLRSLRMELENAAKDLQEVDGDIETLQEIMMMRGPLTILAQYDDIESSSSHSGCYP
jgi:hypothetical protein